MKSLSAMNMAIVSLAVPVGVAGTEVAPQSSAEVRFGPKLVIDIKAKSLNTLPFEVARETAGDRPIPAWLQVVGESQRVLVHQLPERAQIDVPITEQLIVELYSK